MRRVPAWMTGWPDSTARFRSRGFGRADSGRRGHPDADNCYTPFVGLPGWMTGWPARFRSHGFGRRGPQSRPFRPSHRRAPPPPRTSSHRASSPSDGVAGFPPSHTTSATFHLIHRQRSRRVARRRSSAEFDRRSSGRSVSRETPSPVTPSPTARFSAAAAGGTLTRVLSAPLPLLALQHVTETAV